MSGSIYWKFEEINFIVDGPDKGRIHVIWYPAEALVQLLGVAGIHLADVREPPIFGALEKVGFPIRPGERGVKVCREAIPVFGGRSRVSRLHRGLRQLPVLVSEERIGHRVLHRDNGVELPTATQGLVVQVLV